MRLPPLPDTIQNIITFQVPDGLWAQLKFEVKVYFFVQEDVREYLIDVARQDNRIPKPLLGNFAHGHMGGLRSLDVVELIEEMRQLYQHNGDHLAQLWYLYDQAVENWMYRNSDLIEEVEFQASC